MMAGMMRFAVVVVAFGLGACQSVDGGIEDVVMRNVDLNTPQLNGPLLQGPLLQGTLFAGTILRDGQEYPVSGTDFIGSEWDLQVTQHDGQGGEIVEDYTLRLDAIELSDEQDDVYLYDIVYRPAGGAEWKPLCTDGANNPVASIPLQNYWNLETGDRVDEPNVFTFACTNAVLAKCVLWGYRPWASADRCKHQNKPKDKQCDEVSLRDYHQACTRMARADYCGDGTPWTVEGTPIDVQDDLTPPIESPTTDWKLEAEWTPDGAFCLDDMRQQAWKADGMYPACFLDKKGKPIIKKDCGTMKKDRAMMVSTFNIGDDD
jgi:hypothetical protein